MTVQETIPNVQAIRRVNDDDNNNDNTTTTTTTEETAAAASSSRVFHLPYYPDATSGKDILLWEDIRAAFDDVLHVRAGSIILPFLKGPDFKNLDPLRIAAVPSATLDVVVRGPLRERELSLESLQEALPGTPQESAQAPASTTTTTSKVDTAKLNPAGGLSSPGTTESESTGDGQLAIEPQEDVAPQKEDTLKKSDVLQEAEAPPKRAPTVKQRFAATELRARLGDRDAQFALGELYDHGLGAVQSASQAFEWYKKAAGQGLVVTERVEGLRPTYLSDDSFAANWFQKAAVQGHATAQYNLGNMYYTGQEVKKDYSKAFDWYLLAANQDHASASNSVGNLYCVGHGVDQDYSKAAFWYLKAAENGDEEAQNSLAVLYEAGLGVPEDETKAIEWYQKAVDGGYADAQKALDRLKE
ncbi:hypothetical protein BGX24_007718 [Mortierella sp. AD032]|nr:hypothetical protein BGX24_007718 [Mortierella sp. AD032]